MLRWLIPFLLVIAFAIAVWFQSNHNPERDHAQKNAADIEWDADDLTDSSTAYFRFRVQVSNWCGVR